jgi:hypothetical protein
MCGRWVTSAASKASTFEATPNATDDAPCGDRQQSHSRKARFKTRFSFLNAYLMVQRRMVPIFSVSTSRWHVEAKEMTMKKLILTAALATVLVSPALAQSYDPDVGSGNIVPSDYAHATANALEAHARAPHNGVNAFAREDRGVVFQDGAVETDPDPNIRFQLNREAEEGEW